MDHVAGPLHILLAEKEGRNWFILIRLKLYQYGDNYSVVFVYPEIHFEMCFGITLAMCHETYHAGSYPKKSWSPGRRKFQKTM
jgi:hypothetical protein